MTYGAAAEDPRARAEKLMDSLSRGQQVSTARRRALVDALARDFGVAAEEEPHDPAPENDDTLRQVVAPALPPGGLRLGPSMSFHSYVTGHQVFELPAGQQAHITRTESLRWRVQHWVGVTPTPESCTYESAEAALAALKDMIDAQGAGKRA